jgi:predicted DNA-binding transcriptional regulator YafY
MKADRLVSLLLLLQSAQRRTARDLALRLEVSERTIYRDVDALSASGIPVYAERGADGGIALAEGYRKALLHFAEDDIRVLFAGGANALADLGLGANFERALEKLRGGFSDAQRSAAEKARGRIHIDQRRWNQSDPPTEKLALLRRAVWDDRRIELSYEDRMRAQSTRAVDPYGLVSKAGVWYLVAKTSEGFRSFRADRIRELRELDERYERDVAFDLDAHWRETTSKLYETQGRYSVTVRVTADSLSMVTSYWATEAVSPEDPHQLRIMFSSEDSAINALVSWGDSIELIEPDTLRERICEHARMLLNRYAVAPVSS